LPLRVVRGAISWLGPAPPGLRAGLCGDGYLLPGMFGSAGVGATFEDPLAPGAGDALGAGAIDAENLARLGALLAPGPSWDPVVSGRFAGNRCVSTDRLPLVGPIGDAVRCLREREALRGASLADLPRLGGLSCVVALGTRGIALAALAGELLAARLEGEPWPIATAEAQALDPARFLLRALRG